MYLFVILNVTSPQYQTHDNCPTTVSHSIQINHPTRCNSFTSLLLDVHVWLKSVSRASPPIIRSIQLHLQPLVLPLGSGSSSVAGHGLADHDQQRSSRFSPTVKLEAASAVVHAPDDGRGGAQNMLSHTWTSSNELVKLLHLVGYLFELYDDAWTCVRQTVGQFQTWLQQAMQHCNNFGMCVNFTGISLRNNFTTL